MTPGSSTAAGRADAAARAREGTARTLLERLVAERSLEGEPAIDRCLDAIADLLGPLARETVRPVHDGLSSLVMRFGDGPAERRLAFSGHVDVVPAEGDWATDPFTLAERDGLLRGRGTCDMKGGVAAFVTAILALEDAGLLDGCALELVLTGDEEVGSRRGLIPLLESGMVTARRAICGEPTGLDLFLGNRGLVWAAFTVHGRGGHAGQLHHLDDPVPVALRLADELLALPLDARDERFDPDRPTLAITRLDAGATANAPNVVPDRAVVGLDRRLLPGEDVDAVMAALEEAAERAVAEPFRWSVEVQRRWPPYAIEPGDRVAVLAGEAVRAVGRPARLGMDSAANDSSWLDQHGVETLLLGPGAPEQAHVTDEGLEPEQLRDAVRIYARLGATTRQDGA